MDPYLEARWSDVHVRLVSLISEVLQPLLPRDLRARSEERVLLEDTTGNLHSYRSDVALVELPNTAPHAGSGTLSVIGAATLEPVVVELAPRPPFDRFVRIIDVANGNQVVTAIEVLSPWNKRPGRLNEDYRKKLEDYIAGGVSVLEIDLIRSSRGRLEVGQEDLPVERRTPYLAAIRRASRPSRWVVYPIALRQPLPHIPVPLRPKDDDVWLDLQPLIERVYTAGGHDDIDYRKPPEPPLALEDAAWAADLLKHVRPQ
jgi:hypothetical protein